MPIESRQGWTVDDPLAISHLVQRCQDAAMVQQLACNVQKVVHHKRVWIHARCHHMQQCLTFLHWSSAGKSRPKHASKQAA